MIKTIPFSNLDQIELSLCKKNIFLRKNMLTDYKGVIVVKPWGYEYLVFENHKVAVWILFLQKDRSTSMHCHPKKKTALTVLSGKATTSFLDKYFKLQALDALRIDVGVFHSTQANSGGVLILETETPPDKLDLVRLRDEYGREGKGYEGNDKMSKETSEYEYLNLFESSAEADKFIHKNIRDRHLRIQKFRYPKELFDYLKECKKVAVCFLDTVLTTDNSIIVSAGDIKNKAELRKIDFKNMKTNSYLHTLIIH